MTLRENIRWRKAACCSQSQWFMQTTAGEGIFAEVCSPRNWERATEGAEADRPLWRSRCLLQQPGWKRRELDRIKTSSVGFCHQWLLQYQSLCLSLWPASSSFYLFFILPSAKTLTHSRFLTHSLSLSFSPSDCLAVCVFLTLECCFSVCSCSCQLLTLFMCAVSHYPVASICEHVCFCSGTFFRECAEGMSGCVYLWEDLEPWHGRLGLVQP